MPSTTKQYLAALLAQIEFEQHDTRLGSADAHYGEQARFYNSSELAHIDTLDVALLWPPQADGQIDG